MTKENRTATSVEEALAAARRLDATCSEELVVRYLLEIGEMQAILDGVDVAGQPLPSGFSPYWPDGDAE